jgi:RES domain
VLPWNKLRTYGPLPSMRWDPHPGLEPIGSRAEGVLYAAADVATSLAEVYQTTRVIDTRAGTATLTAWQPQLPLRLLDLSGTWLLRNTASAALLAAPRSICRRWARAIYTREIDCGGTQLTNAASNPRPCRDVPPGDWLQRFPGFTRF